MSKIKIQSVESRIAQLGNDWLKNYNLDYKLENENLNYEIDNALSEYFSKTGGIGGNRPDAKILLEYNGKFFPVLIEYKGHENKLVKLNSEGKVENKKNNEPHYQNIKNFAVNGAVHYANAILHYTNYTDIIAIGMTGYKDEKNILQHKIAVYFVSTKNLGIGQEVGKYTDFSFLKPEHFPQFIDEIKKLSLTEQEFQKLKIIRELEIDASLVKLNNDIYQSEKGLSEQDRIYLVVASIMATLGVHGKVSPLEKNDLKSSNEKNFTDGDILMKKVENFLSERNLPEDKKNLIVRTLQNTVTSANLNKVIDGKTQLKRVFSKIVDDLGIYYKIGLTTDFTGKLFNEMYNWLGFTQDKLNDVVITPPYVAKLLVKLCRTNQNSKVWDYATGSAGLLIAAMNEMIIDAREKIKSPDKLREKINSIRSKQILGIEILPSIYMLAVLNMILMGDGSSKILNLDSLKDFDGNFDADVFVLNPPYSAAGNGMIFVENALNKMKSGYAAIIIQNSAGTGKAIDFNKKILQKNTLLASIKMPIDLFIGKSSVQTNIYVFRVGEPHNSKSIVKFIDFSNDGYKRTNRKKSRQNLQDIDHAAERYEELVNLVHYGRKHLKFFSENEYYEGTIDPESGKDWNQSAPIDTRPQLADFKKTVSDFLAFEVTNILKNNSDENEKKNSPLAEKLNNVEWSEFLLKNLFEIKSNPQLNKDSFTFSENGAYPYFTRTVFNNGLLGYVDYFDEEHKISGGCLAVGMIGMQFFYMEKDFYAGQFTKRAIPKNFTLTKKTALFFISLLNSFQKTFQEKLVRDFEKTFYQTKIKLPTKNGEIDFEFMEEFIAELEAERISELEAYLTAAGLKDTKLTESEKFALENLNSCIWQKFYLTEIFKMSNTKSIVKEKIIPDSGKIPYVTASSENNGVMTYVNCPSEWTDKGNCIMIGGKTLTFTFQEKDFCSNDSHNIVLYAKNSEEKIFYLFYMSAMRAAMQNKYSWGNSISMKKIQEEKIYLPTKDGAIDYEFMEKFISAVQKTVIADVVKYSGEKISAYRQVANK